jgi:hypothetical protein
MHPALLIATLLPASWLRRWWDDLQCRASLFVVVAISRSCKLNLIYD